MTYQEKISTLEIAWSDELCDVVISRADAENVAEDADDEIQKLKGLLADARWLLADSGCKNFIDEIEKALYD